MTRQQVLFSPVTRLSGLLSVQAVIDGAAVIDASVSGTMFRGYEWIMQGRDVTDAIYMTQRICGICSLAHGATASYLLDQLFGHQLSEQAQLLRNVMYGADFLQNHLRHFYVYSLPDFVRFPPRPPFLGQRLDDARLSTAVEAEMIQHYFAAISTSQLCHQILALFGGKAPHQHSFVHGGVTVGPTAQSISEALALLDRAESFIGAALLPDTYRLAEAYQDYYQIGVTPERLLSFGLFPLGAANDQRVWRTGALAGGRLVEVDPLLIHEDVASSWFASATQPSEPPPAQGVVPDPYKPGAYSWVKSVTYGGQPYESGPLARMLINGYYQGGTSTMDRIVARSIEAQLIARLMRQWLDRLNPGEPPLAQQDVPLRDESRGMTDSMRGALLHHAKLNGRSVESYDIITPSAWNFSPKNSAGQRGPAECALTGTVIPQGVGPTTVLGRIIRSFDPCLSCGTHVYTPAGDKIAERVV